MQKKGNNSDQPLGICHRLFNFIMNSLIARGVKRVTLGRPVPHVPTDAGDSPMERMLKPKEDLGPVIQIEFSQNNGGLEYWTLADKVGSSVHVLGTKGKESKEMEPISAAGIRAREPRKSVSIKDGEKKDKGKNVAISENLTLAIESENTKIKHPRHLLNVASNINEKSAAFIRSRKEAMRRNYGIEPKIS